MTTPRVRSLSLETSHRDDARRAVRAACSPFGSLSDEIADLALAYLDDGCSPESGIALLRATDCQTELRTALTAARHGEWSEVLLGGSRVQFITPTSGTVIELRYAGHRWRLTVDFGPLGSDSRADQIIERDTESPDLAWQVTPIDTQTIAQPEPAPSGETMAVGIGDAKGMPPGLAEELAGIDPADRAVAERISDQPLIDPARPGWEQRAVDRAKREGVLP